MPEVIFNGPDGRLEGRYHKSKQADAPIAIGNPHPLHGGNMNNRIVYIMYNAFVERGFVLRFNFRGVGRSRIFDNGVGELSDAATCLTGSNNSTLIVRIAGLVGTLSAR